MKKQLPVFGILALLSSILAGCGNSSSKGDAALSIGGLGPGGGVIFAFLDDTNSTGLEVFTSSIGQGAWGCVGVTVEEDESRASNGVSAPSGAISSEALRVATSSGICMSAAAELAFSFSNNDLEDWYLPSTDELITIRELGLLPGEPGDAYWFATENTDLNAFVVLIRAVENPQDNGEPSTSGKGNTAKVIPIRTFRIN